MLFNGRQREGSISGEHSAIMERSSGGMVHTVNTILPRGRGIHAPSVYCNYPIERKSYEILDRHFSFWTLVSMSVGWSSTLTKCRQLIFLQLVWYIVSITVSYPVMFFQKYLPSYRYFYEFFFVLYMTTGKNNRSDPKIWEVCTILLAKHHDSQGSDRDGEPKQLQDK